MVIKKEHAQALERLLADEEAQKPYTPLEEVDEPTFVELELAGLARFSTPVRLVPTYLGREVAFVLRELYEQGPQARSEREDEVQGEVVVLEGRGLSRPEDWPEGWRWIGSEVIAMLDAAERAGRVGPAAVEALMERGLAVRVRDRETKKEYVRLSDAGRRMLELYREAEPGLEIDAELAEAVRKLPLGPAPASELPTPAHDEQRLEAMRLVAYSLPNSDVFAFTALGQAVKKALSSGGWGKGDVFTSDLLWALADYVDTGEATEAGLATLQELGYVGPAGELLPAGEWALEALRLWQGGVREEVWSFALEAEEAEVLEQIAKQWQKASETNPEERPTFEVLRRAMIDRKVAEYKALVEKYGRKLDEMPQKFRLIAERFQGAQDLARWYDENFDLREALLSLESFSLIETGEDEKGKEVFYLTDWGEYVLEDQRANRRDVSATAVKAITMTRKSFSASSLAWWQEAHEQGLVGSAEPTRSGLLYAQLAEHAERLPHLSRYELMVFHVVPARGMSEEEVYAALEKKLDRERIRWALEKLEARHLIDRLPDGNVVETRAGELLDRALAGVPEGFGNPVNPVIFRLLEALRAVGSLYVKEKRVRILPRNLKEALEYSGLPKEVFDDALEAARAAGLVGRSALNEAGLLLLEAAEAMNPGEEVHGLVELE
ncbi:MAG TPA: DUF505 domain-containing protein [Oceanithermus profundus]|uniref:DUF505 domain-containing protein n=1 Tax=Oceanithermus profundus TaxID=187137 RepID=A0A7C4ZHH8_9DEIN|nr:DUF505 domain-containing protein [Oceanithermus profundus]